jgi:hypothetical protein
MKDLPTGFIPVRVVFQHKDPKGHKMIGRDLIQTRVISPTRLLAGVNTKTVWYNTAVSGKEPFADGN